MLNQISSNLLQYIQNGEFSVLFLLISFLGGVLSSISPCSLGMIPLIVGYVGGYGDRWYKTSKKIFWHVLYNKHENQIKNLESN